MKLEGARVVVVGMARSGVAAVELLIEKGARVTAVDAGPVNDERLERLGHLGAAADRSLVRRRPI